MNKNFTAEDIQKKLQTDVKSAQTVFTLAIVLGIIYVVRYFFTRNFDSFFSLSFTDTLLNLSNDGKIPFVAAIVLVCLYIGVYIVLSVLSLRNSKYFTACLGIYIFDFACLLLQILVIYKSSFSTDSLIDVILHLFVVTFLVVGIRSYKKSLQV